MKKNLLKYGNLAIFIAMIVLNVLAATGVLGGISTKEVSDSYKSLLTPADYAFSIWSLIYVLTAIMVFRQLKNDELRENLSYLFIASCSLNCGWILAWQFKAISLSFIFIFALLMNLILLMRNVRNSDTLTSLVVGLYTGWINVAMLANLGALFSRYNWKLFRMESNISTIIALVFGLLWIGYFIILYRNPFYAAGAAWGYMGIFFNSVDMSIMLVTIISVLIFAGLVVFKIFKNSIDCRSDCCYISDAKN